MNECDKRSKIQKNKYHALGAYHWQLYKEKNSLYYPLVRYVVNLIPTKQKVLDYGCGDGVISSLLQSEKDCKVIGIDYDIEAIRLAKSKNSNVEFICSNIDTYTNGQHLDWTIAIDVIEHLEHPQSLLKKMTGKKNLIGTPERRDNIVKKHPAHMREYNIEELMETVKPYLKATKIDLVPLIGRLTRNYIFLFGEPV